MPRMQEPATQRPSWREARLAEATADLDADETPEPYQVGIARWRATVATYSARTRPVQAARRRAVLPAPTDPEGTP